MFDTVISIFNIDCYLKFLAKLKRESTIRQKTLTSGFNNLFTTITKILFLEGWLSSRISSQFWHFQIVPNFPSSYVFRQLMRHFVYNGFLPDIKYHLTCTLLIIRFFIFSDNFIIMPIKWKLNFEFLLFYLFTNPRKKTNSLFGEKQQNSLIKFLSAKDYCLYFYF